MIIRIVFFACSLFFCGKGISQDLTSLYQQVSSAISFGNYTEAIVISKKAVELARTSKGEISKEHHVAVSSLAYVYSLTGDYRDALEQHQKAYDITKELYDADHYFHLDAAFRLAETYARLGKTKQSNELVKKYQRALDDLQKIASLDSLSETLSNNNRFVEAEKVLQEEIAITRKYFRNNHNNTITPLLRLGHSYRNRGLFPEALQVFKEAIEAYEGMDPQEQRPYYQATLDHLAKMYQETGRYDESEKLLMKSLESRRRENQYPSIAYTATLNTLSGLYKTAGRYSDGISVLQEALTIIKKLEGVQSLAFATSTMYLADLYFHNGSYAKAESLATQSLNTIRKTEGEDDKKITMLNNLATLYGKLGNYELALSFFSEAIRLLQDGGEELFDEASGLFTNMGSLAMEASEYDFADSCFAKAIELQKSMGAEQHPDYGRLLVQSALIKLKKHEFTNARQVLEDARQVFSDAGVLQNFENVAFHTAYALLEEAEGKLQTAMQHLQQAEKIIITNVGKDHPDFGNSLVNQGLLYWRMNDEQNAKTFLLKGAKVFLVYTQKNILFLSEDEKVQLLNHNTGYADAMLSLLHQQKTKDPAFLIEAMDYLLQIKGMILFDASGAMAAARKSKDTTLHRLLEDWQFNRALVAKYYTRPGMQVAIDSLNTLINSTSKLINQHSAELRAFRENALVTTNDIRWKLKPGEAAVEFVHFDFYQEEHNTDSVLYGAFVITSSDSIPTYIPLSSEKKLQQLLLPSKKISAQDYAASLYRGVTITNTNQTGSKGDSLYHLIWKPVELKLDGANKVFISAAGLLNKVAFAALPIAKGRYLSDKFSIRQYYTLRDIQKEASHSIPASATIYGGIDYGQKNSSASMVFDPIPGTLTEVEKITDLFKASSGSTMVKVVTGTAATEKSFKELDGSSPTIIHLATHGFYQSLFNNPDKKKPKASDPLLRCGLVFSGVNNKVQVSENEGILTGYEIAQLDLSKMDLAVLSACETGLGDIKGSEGVYGLQRAFKMAGVQKMIISLWPVPDKETSELMGLFYQGLLVGQPADIALNEARLALRQKYSPYYWAAFVLLE